MTTIFTVSLAGSCLQRLLLFIGDDDDDDDDALLFLRQVMETWAIERSFPHAAPKY